MESISERIFIELKKNNKRQIDLVQWLNTSGSTVSDWKKYNRTPPAELIPKIASFLNVSLEFLLTGNNSNNDDLNEFDQEILNICKELNNRQKAELITFANKLLQND